MQEAADLAQRVHLGGLLLEAPDELHLGEEPPGQLRVEPGGRRRRLRLRHERSPPDLGAATDAYHRISAQLVHGEPAAEPEDGHDDGEADRHFRRRHAHHEEHEDLPLGRAVPLAEGDEGEVGGVEHHLDGHEDHERVAPDEHARARPMLKRTADSADVVGLGHHAGSGLPLGQRQHAHDGDEQQDGGDLEREQVVGEEQRARPRLDAARARGAPGPAPASAAERSISAQQDEEEPGHAAPRASAAPRRGSGPVSSLPGISTMMAKTKSTAMAPA